MARFLVVTFWRDVLQIFLAGLVGLTMPCAAYSQTARPAYTVAVVPQFQAVEIQRVWAPILAKAGGIAGVTLTLQPAKDIPTFEDEVMAGRPDFAYMNPYHAVMAKKAAGYAPLVRDSKLLTGILVVRQDDPIQSVRQLEGKAVAFPAPNAFGASLLIRAQLAEVDKVHIQPMYAKTHTNAYRQTILGMTAASGGVRATLEKESDEVRATLRVLTETPGAPPHPLCVHPRVPVTVQRAVTAALLQLAGDASLQPLFKDIPMSQPVKADYRRDYQPLEKLQLERYVEQ